MAEGSLALYAAIYSLDPDVWKRSALQDGLALVDRQLAPKLVCFSPKSFLLDRRRSKVEAWRPASIIENVFPNGLWLNTRRSDLPEHYRVTAVHAGETPGAGGRRRGDDDADAPPPSHIHHCVLTDLASGAAAHAHLLTRYYPITDAPRLGLLNQQVGARLMERPPEALLATSIGSPGDAGTMAGGVRDLFRQAHRAYEPRCVAIVTAEPLYETMRAVLASFDEWLPRTAVLRHAHARLLHGALSHGPTWAARLLGSGSGSFPQQPPLRARRRGRSDGSGGDATAAAVAGDAAALPPVPEDDGGEAGEGEAAAAEGDAGPLHPDLLRRLEDAGSGDEEEEEDAGGGLAPVRALSRIDWRRAGLHRLAPPAQPGDAATAATAAGAAPARRARSHSLGLGASGGSGGLHHTLLALRLPWTMAPSDDAAAVAAPEAAPADAGAARAHPAASEAAEVVLCVPPPSAHSWELPQVPWECPGCWRRVDGVLRAALVEAAAAAATPGEDARVGEGAFTPLSDLVRCVESGLCAACTLSAAQSGGDGGGMGGEHSRLGGVVRAAAAAAPSLQADAAALPPNQAPKRPEPLFGPFVISPDDPLLPYALGAGRPASPAAAVPPLFTLKSPSGLSPVDFDPRPLFSRLSPANIVTALTALLLEHTVVVLCRDTSVLPDVFSALIALMHPLQVRSTMAWGR